MCLASSQHDSADESGYKFSWGALRNEVVDAITGAGRTYKPKKF